MHVFHATNSTAARRARALLFPLAATAFAAACAAPSSKPVGDKPAVASFMEIRAPGSPVLAPDGSMYVRDWPDGVWQLYRYKEPARSGATSTKLSAFTDGLSSYSLAPDGQRLVLAAARGGNEQTQLSLLDPDATGTAGTGTPLLDNVEAVFALNEWFADSSGFIYSANDRNPNDFHLYRFDFDGADSQRGHSTSLLAREGSWSAGDVTADKRRVLVARFLSASNTEIYELDAQSGALRDLRPLANGQATSASTLVGYMPGEQAVLMISDASDAQKGLQRLHVRELESGKLTRPLPALDGYELDGAAINEARDILAVVANVDGYGVLSAYHLPDFAPIALPPIERGVVALSSLRGNTLIWTLSNARTPGLSFAYDVPPRDKKSKGSLEARQLTWADERGVDLASFPLPELVHYASFDGLSIPAFLYLPPHYEKGAPIPFVVNYHGGPEGQHRPGFDRTTQALLARGFGVLQPNVRGSTGYGRVYQMLDDYKLRRDSVRDGVEAARWLVREGYSQNGKIAAYGGSYGGFMSVATIVEGPEVFGASVDVVGIVNMKTFLEQTKGYRRKLREAEYGPLTDPEFLATISPLERASEIKIPMLIAHGLNDPRVPVGEAMQLAVNLQKRGLSPELYYFPDEGHGFQRLDNRLLFTERMVRFLERTIGADAKQEPQS